MTPCKFPRILIIATTAVLALGSAAMAEKKEIRVANGLTPRQFVSNCESMNGTIEEGSQSSDGLSCTLPSGTSADCSFGPKDAYCEVTTPRSSLPARTTKSLLCDSTLHALQ